MKPLLLNSEQRLLTRLDTFNGAVYKLRLAIWHLCRDIEETIKPLTYNTMTPKEKARLLISLMSVRTDKQRALTVLDEILELDVKWMDKSIVDDYPQTYSKDQTKEYWQEVKTELLNM